MPGLKPLPPSELDARLDQAARSLGVTITVRDLTGWLRGNDGKSLIDPRRFSHQQQAVCAKGFAPACVATCRHAASAGLRARPQAHVQTCWKGVREVVVPLVRDGTLQGYCFAGAWRGERPPRGSPWAAAWRDLPDWDPVRGAAVAAALGLVAEGLWEAAEALRGGGLAGDDRAAVIRRFIRDHLALASVRLALARHLGLTPSRTSHLVREIFGRSLQALVNEERLHAAQRHLADTQDPVADIGAAVGWPDAPHFARIFRRLSGRSPARWRAEHRLA